VAIACIIVSSFLLLISKEATNVLSFEGLYILKQPSDSLNPINPEEK
jgi:hypothetical protein